MEVVSKEKETMKVGGKHEIKVWNEGLSSAPTDQKQVKSWWVGEEFWEVNRIEKWRIPKPLVAMWMILKFGVEGVGEWGWVALHSTPLLSSLVVLGVWSSIKSWPSVTVDKERNGGTCPSTTAIKPTPNPRWHSSPVSPTLYQPQTLGYGYHRHRFLFLQPWVLILSMGSSALRLNQHGRRRCLSCFNFILTLSLLHVNVSWLRFPFIKVSIPNSFFYMHAMQTSSNLIHVGLSLYLVNFFSDWIHCRHIFTWYQLLQKL